MPGPSGGPLNTFDLSIKWLMSTFNKSTHTLYMYHVYMYILYVYHVYTYTCMYVHIQWMQWYFDVNVTMTTSPTGTWSYWGGRQTTEKTWAEIHPSHEYTYMYTCTYTCTCIYIHIHMYMYSLVVHKHNVYHIRICTCMLYQTWYIRPKQENATTTQYKTQGSHSQRKCVPWVGLEPTTSAF